MSPTPRVFVWELNDAEYCELKRALALRYGDARTPRRALGRSQHEELKSTFTALAAASIAGSVVARQALNARWPVDVPHPTDTLRLESEVSLCAEDLGLQGRADLVLSADRPHVIELKSTAPPASRKITRGTGAFASDAVQVLGYGLLLESVRSVAPRLWVAYLSEEDRAKVRALAADQLDVRHVVALLGSGFLESVPMNSATRQRVAARIERVRAIKRTPDAAIRTHSLRARCRPCLFRERCPERLQ